MKVVAEAIVWNISIWEVFSIQVHFVCNCFWKYFQIDFDGSFYKLSGLLILFNARMPILKKETCCLHLKKAHTLFLIGQASIVGYLKYNKFFCQKWLLIFLCKIKKRVISLGFIIHKKN